MNCIDGFYFTPVWIYQVTKIEYIKGELDRIFSFTNIHKDILDKFNINLVSPGSLCAVTFSILSFMSSQVFVLVNIFKEHCALFCSSVINTIWIRESCQNVISDGIFWNIDKIITIESIAVEISTINIREPVIDGAGIHH